LEPRKTWLESVAWQHFLVCWQTRGATLTHNPPFPILPPSPAKPACLMQTWATDRESRCAMMAKLIRNKRRNQNVDCMRQRVGCRIDLVSLLCEAAAEIIPPCDSLGQPPVGPICCFATTRVHKTPPTWAGPYEQPARLIRTTEVTPLHSVKDMR